AHSAYRWTGHSLGPRETSGPHQPTPGADSRCSLARFRSWPRRREHRRPERRRRVPMTLAVLTVALRHEQDVVVARQRTRQLAGLLGFDSQDQTRLATAVSEI